MRKRDGAALFCAALLRDGIAKRAAARIAVEAMLQDQPSMLAASTATNRRTSTPLGIEAALAPVAAAARACARSEPAASETVTPWEDSAR